MERKIFVPTGRMMSHSCRHCGGSGKATCIRCQGYGTMSDGAKCYYCQGAGKTTCNACGGSGTIDD